MLRISELLENIQLCWYNDRCNYSPIRKVGHFQTNLQWIYLCVSLVFP